MITHKDITGWFDKASEYVYASAVDRFGKSMEPTHFVEIGAYMGQSTCFMAQEIKKSGKNIKFDVVDHFIGSPEHQRDLKGKNLYQIFVNNMLLADVLWDMHVFVMDSIQASKLYKDESLDFVFIDADHSYVCCKADILAWLPKIKQGGVLAGDDYIPVHPGVMKAVNEIFGVGTERKRTYGRIWLHDK